MHTAKQIEASRINGAKSRGPRSTDGKRISSQNALRHQAVVHSLALELEGPDQFHLLLQELTAESSPAVIRRI